MSDDKKIIVKSDPVTAWKMEELCILLQLTCKSKNTVDKCPSMEFFLVRIFPYSDRIPRDTFMFMSIACIFSMLGYSMVGFFMF